MTSRPPAKKRRTEGSKKPPMHSGRWTPEEEEYVEGMIAEFTSGQLPIAEGTTLRSFLAKMLNCNPKRVSKKYDGNPIYNGKSAYVRSRNPLPPAETTARQGNLLELERKFREALLTMQRVESRLQSLTSHLMPEQEPAVAIQKTNTVITKPSGVQDSKMDDSVPSTCTASGESAVSSLTDYDEERNSMDLSVRRVVSEQDSDATKAAATSAEEAASQVLMLLNASKPVPQTITAPSPTNKRPAPCPETQKPNQPPAPAAAPIIGNPAPAPIQLTPPQANNAGALQGLLQNLQGIRQHQAPVQHPKAQGASLQSFLGLQQQQQPRLESPLTQPRNAQSNLQQFMQSLQQQQQQQSSNTFAAPQQQSSQQANTDLYSVLQTLYQQKQQQQQAPKPETDLTSLLGSLMQGRNANQGQAQVNAGGNQVLQTVLQQIGKQKSTPPPAPTQQQSAVQTIIQGLVNQQQNQVSHQPPPPPPRQQTDANLVSNFVNQLQQNMVQQPPQQPHNVQSLLQSLSAARPAPKAIETPAPASNQASLQTLLMQLQQQNPGSSTGLSQFLM